MSSIRRLGETILLLGGASALACSSAPGADPAARPTAGPSTPPPVVHFAEPLPPEPPRTPPPSEEPAATEVRRAAPVEPLETVGEVRIRLEQEATNARLLLDGPGLRSCLWRPIASDRLRIACPDAEAAGEPDAPRRSGPVAELRLVSAAPLDLVVRTRRPVVGQWSSTPGGARFDLRAETIRAPRASTMPLPPPLAAGPTPESAEPPRVEPVARSAEAPPEPAERPPPVRREGRFELQLGAFSIPENAEAELARWRELGYDPYVVPERTRSGRELRTVRVGPWEDREDAERVQRLLSREHGQESIVRRR